MLTLYLQGVEFIRECRRTQVKLQTDVLDGDPNDLIHCGQVIVMTPEEYACITQDKVITAPDYATERALSAKIDELNKKIAELEARPPIIYEASF